MKNNKGFSLVELIVVIAIMAILAAVAIPTFAHFINKANEASDKDFAAGIEYAVDIALAGDADESVVIAVTCNATTGKIEKLTYTNGDKTGNPATDVIYVAIGEVATGEQAAPDEIKEAINSIVDKDYELKTAGVAVGKVSINGVTAN